MVAVGIHYTPCTLVVTASHRKRALVREGSYLPACLRIYSEWLIASAWSAECRQAAAPLEAATACGGQPRLALPLPVGTLTRALTGARERVLYARPKPTRIKSTRASDHGP